MTTITFNAQRVIVMCIFLSGALLSAQDIDTDFSTDGMTTTTFTPEKSSSSRAVAVQDDGKLVAVGYDDGVTDGAFAIARYTPNGEIDTSFGTDGKVIYSVNGLQSDAYEIDIDSMGNIYVAGIANSGTEETQDLVAVMIKLNSSGTVDSTFGSGGVVSTDFGATLQSFSTSVLVQDDGKVLLGGSIVDAQETPDDADFAISRFDSDGNVDLTFGNAGFTITDLGAYDTLFKLGLQSDGAIIGAGYSISNLSTENESSNAVAIRLKSDGSLDTSFGTNGSTIVNMNTEDYTYDVAIHSNDKIVLAGETLSATSSDFFTLKLTADGALDSTFGTNGTVITDFLGDQDTEEAFSVTIQQNEKIVVSGAVGRPGELYVAITRLLPNGNPDNGFGQNGKYLYALDAIDKTVIQDGELIPGEGNTLVLAGRTNVTSSRTSFFLAQFDLDAQLSTENSDFAEVRVYPNPTTAQLKVALANKTTTASLKIYDTSGRMVMSEQLLNEGAVNVASLASGTYLLQVAQGDKYFTKKIIKN